MRTSSNIDVPVLVHRGDPLIWSTVDGRVRRSLRCVRCGSCRSSVEFSTSCSPQSRSRCRHHLPAQTALRDTPVSSVAADSAFSHTAGGHFWGTWWATIPARRQGYRYSEASAPVSQTWCSWQRSGYPSTSTRHPEYGQVSSTISHHIRHTKMVKITRDEETHEWETTTYCRRSKIREIRKANTKETEK